MTWNGYQCGNICGNLFGVEFLALYSQSKIEFSISCFPFLLWQQSISCFDNSKSVPRVKDRLSVICRNDVKHQKREGKRKCYKHGYIGKGRRESIKIFRLTLVILERKRKKWNIAKFLKQCDLSLDWVLPGNAPNLFHISSFNTVYPVANIQNTTHKYKMVALSSYGGILGEHVERALAYRILPWRNRFSPRRQWKSWLLCVQPFPAFPLPSR